VAITKFEITVRETIDEDWAESLSCVGTRRGDNGSTVLTCAVLDSVALLGILEKVRDLNLTLLTVTRIDT